MIADARMGNELWVKFSTPLSLFLPRPASSISFHTPRLEDHSHLRTMASPPPPGSAGQEEAPDPPGLPPTERLESGLDPLTLDASLETRSLGPDPESTPPSHLPAKPTGGPQIGPLKLETTGLGLDPKQEPDTQSQTNVPRAAQQSQTPETPVLGPKWRKRVINVKNKIGSTRPKQPASVAPTSQGPEALGLDSSKLAHGGDQGKATEAGKAGTTKREANPPEIATFVDLSNLPLSLVPTSNIVAIPDIGQTSSTAWAYTVEKNYARRPGASSKQPQAPGDTTLASTQASRQAPPKSPASFRAGLKALEESKSRAEREGQVRGRIQGWTDTIDIKGPERPPASVADEPTAAPMDKGKRRDDGGDISVSEDVERGRRPLTPQRLRVSSVEDAVSKKTDADDRTSRHSNRPSSTRGSKPPSERDRGGKAGNWLTDRTMLPYDVHRARVWGFDYKPLEPTQSLDNPAKKKADYDKYLHETACELLRSLARRVVGSGPLIFVAIGFGCLIVQKAIALAYTYDDADSSLQGAGVLFFDAPSPIPKEKPKTEKAKTAPVPTALLPTFPAPANSTRANKVRAILESKGIDSWDLWERFNERINYYDLPVIWFHNQAQTNRNVGAHNPLPPSRFPFHPSSSGRALETHMS